MGGIAAAAADDEDEDDTVTNYYIKYCNAGIYKGMNAPTLQGFSEILIP